MIFTGFFKPVFLLFPIILIFPCCISAQSNQSPQAAANEANSMAKDAVQRLEAALNGVGNAASRNRRAEVSVSAAPAEETRGGKQPSWVNDPYSVYRRDLFIAAVGSGANRSEAANKALGELIAIFGRSVRSEYTVNTNYTEAVKRGIVKVSESTSVQEKIATAASMYNLIGAETGNVWDSGRGTVYAAAYLDIERTIDVYSGMIIINNQNINMLTAMSSAEKNTFDGYARYKLASQIAGINSNYAAVVKQAGGSTAHLNLKTPESLNLEASNIIRNITINVRVTNDRANRIQDAFVKALGSEGLRTRGNAPLYSLEVNLKTSEPVYPGDEYNYKWFRIEASANLIENSSGQSLFVFPLNERAGHNSPENASNAAYSAVEKTIAEKYAAALREYLASLIPM